MKLEVKDIGFSYIRGCQIFQSVSFSLQDGECLSILGANGAGKSTLLNCLSGILAPQSGQILLDGTPVASMSRTELARVLGYVPQLHDSCFAYTVLEFAVMGRTPYIKPYRTPSREDYDIARANLQRVGMGGMEGKIFTEMSGGEQQLVMLARVLTQEPRIILLDEPTNHLDYGNQYRTVEMISRLSGEGYIVIMTTHNPDHALMLGGRAAILDAGGALRMGPVNDILTADDLSALYHMNIGVVRSEEAGRTICFMKSTSSPSA